MNIIKIIKIIKNLCIISDMLAIMIIEDVILPHMIASFLLLPLTKDRRYPGGLLFVFIINARAAFFLKYMKYL